MISPTVDEFITTPYFLGILLGQRNENIKNIDVCFRNKFMSFGTSRCYWG